MSMCYSQVLVIIPDLKFSLGGFPGSSASGGALRTPPEASDPSNPPSVPFGPLRRPQTPPIPRVCSLRSQQKSK
ncbi:hypothetical protein GPJ56_007519 [Histomonas meleagridis]|uniref:uncharacterized protein n=1 Tax=Histomonas meleagridis TaxID=135588 RepID=UPI0035599437|nr:hypothetical protein GPJ56_007519 [Histomonas meleagridis]KAH0801168.1 hypothetical protein GO595_006203 [Histomonas meleagridis]